MLFKSRYLTVDLNRSNASIYMDLCSEDFIKNNNKSSEIEKSLVVDVEYSEHLQSLHNYIPSLHEKNS